MRRLFALPLLVGVLTGCPPSIDTGADGGGVIDATSEGGIFIRGGAVIEIPKGALESNVQIVITVVDNGVPEVPDRKRVSLGYRFSPSSLTFKSPVKIGIPYLEDRIPTAVQTSTFDLRRSTPDAQYAELPSTEIVSEYKAVLAQTDRLGLFWVTGPAEAAVSELKIDPENKFMRVTDTQAFTATLTDPTGQVIPDAGVVWSIVPPRVASIDSAGVVTAKAPGTATVTATVGSTIETTKVYVPGDTPGPRAFLHDNPFPTGNDLFGGTMAAGQAFFVGGNATVLQLSTTQQWSRPFSSPGVNLRAVGGTPANAVAVGELGTTGLLIELVAGSTTPSVKTFPTCQPKAIWFDGNVGMAVGYGNDVIVRRSGQWVKEYSPSVETLLSVVGDGLGGFTTVGSRGSIYRFDPVTQTWNSLYQSQLAVLLTAATVVDIAGTEAWAVGGGKLWKFAGAWTPINLPASPVVSELTAVTKVDGKLALAGSVPRQGYLFLYDPVATTWGSSVTLRAPQIVRGIFGSGAEGYAVGDLGAVWKYQGGTFAELSHGFYGDISDVSVATPAPGVEVVVAAANECSNAACSQRVGKVMIRTGPSSWAVLGGEGSQPFDGPVHTVLARNATEVYAGGDGYVFKYDGTSWTGIGLVGGPPAKIHALTFCGGTMWAVGPAGANFKGLASLMNQPALGFNNLYSVFCSGENQVWAAGTNSLFENRTPRNTEGVNHGDWRTVWSPGSGEAFAFGDARYGVYWDTKQLNAIDTPGGVLPDVIENMWGSSVDNLYAVGHATVPFTFGFAIRSDGATWTQIDSGAHRKGTAIDGASNLIVWIGTEGGGLLRGVPPQ